MGQERRHFTDEFKTEAVAMLASSGCPLVQIAGNWISRPRCCATGAITAADGMRGQCHTHNRPWLRLPDPAAEISRLRRENDRLRMECDILKGCGDLLGTAEMRFRLIEDHRSVWPVQVMRCAERAAVGLLRAAITAREPAQDC